MDEGHNSSEQEMTQGEMVDLFVKHTGITFEKFKRDPSILRKSKEHLLEIADKGQSIFSNVKKQRYILQMNDGRKYKTDTLEKMQYIMDCEGVVLNECIMKPEFREGTSGFISLDVVYVDKGVRREKKSSIIL